MSKGFMLMLLSESPRGVAYITSMLRQLLSHCLSLTCVEDTAVQFIVLRRLPVYRSSR